MSVAQGVAPPTTLNDQINEKKALSMMSKKRYQEIAVGLKEIIGDNEKLEEALSLIQDIMKFDPEKKYYTPELGKRMSENRKKLAEERGISIYEISGSKASRERKKNITLHA